MTERSKTAEKMDHLDTMLREWKAFDSRHPEYSHLRLGGLTWGLLRALAECPQCPGAFRVPYPGPVPEGLTVRGELWACPQCGGVWDCFGSRDETKKKARKRRK